MKKHVALFSSVLMMSTTLLGAGSVFADSNEVDITNPNTTTPVTADLTIPSVPSPEPPTDGEHNNNVEGHLGIAYQPNAFNGKKELSASGETRIGLTNNGAPSFHVGVKDTTRKKNNWTLKASISFNEGDSQKYLQGTTINITSGTVKKNNGNKTLVDLEHNEVVGQSEVTISKTPSLVMGADPSQTQNGVYDYGFDKAHLVIPNSENVPAGSYSGNVTWNLEMAPGVPN